MDSRPRESAPYRESGRLAAVRLQERPVIGRFMDLLKPEALERRGQDVARRGRGLKAAAAGAALAALACGVFFCARAAQVFDGTLDGLVAANWYGLGTVVALAASWWGVVAFSQGQRLERTGRKLHDRAQLQRRIEDAR
jgi:hypothetical protein